MTEGGQDDDVVGRPDEQQPQRRPANHAAIVVLYTICAAQQRRHDERRHCCIQRAAPPTRSSGTKDPAPRRSSRQQAAAAPPHQVPCPSASFRLSISLQKQQGVSSPRRPRQGRFQRRHHRTPRSLAAEAAVIRHRGRETARLRDRKPPNLRRARAALRRVCTDRAGSNGVVSRTPTESAPRSQRERRGRRSPRRRRGARRAPAGGPCRWRPSSRKRGLWGGSAQGAQNESLRVRARASTIRARASGGSLRWQARVHRA